MSASDAITTFFKKLLGISSTMLRWPVVLHSLIIPLFLFSYAIKLLLEEMRIFSSSTVNWIIGIVVSLALLFLIAHLGPLFASLGIFAICFFKIRGAKGILVGAGLGFVYFVWINPLLITHLA